jgi:methionyl-tRNA formyltransferase
MGTPEFAVPSLRVLVEAGYNVVGVITAVDKPKGRGQKVAVSPVKEYAQGVGLNILQPPNLKNPEFIEELRSLKANLQVVVAFRMLPEVVWDMPELGTFNLHASLLPQYRGAAPINWAIINGEKETGVTTFFLKHEIDTGSIIFQESEPIHPEDTAGSLYERLMHKGEGIVLKTVNAIEAGQVEALPQPVDQEIKHAPKIFREDCEINWDQPAKRVNDFIRGLSPYPGAWMQWNDQLTAKIFTSTISNNHKEGNPGDRVSDNERYLHIKCSDSWLSIEELQLQGKKRMKIEDFLRGNRIE